MKPKLKLLAFATLPLVGILFNSVPTYAYQWNAAERASVGRVSERDMRSFDAYLDSHWETAQELYRNPDLLKDRSYIRKHDALDDWLDEHSEAAREIRANPRAFLWRARAYQQRQERDPLARVSEKDLRSLRDYLDSHDETARELYRNPDLINDRKYVRQHDALDDWLDEHPEAAREIRANPLIFLKDQRATSGRRVPTTRMTERDLRSFETYLNSDWQTAQELYRNPDLVNDRRFVRNHPDLRDWLEDHPDAAATIQANPNQFLWRKRSIGAQDFLNQLLTPR